MGTNWTFEMVFNTSLWKINTFALIFGTHVNESKTTWNISKWMFSEWLNFVWHLTYWNLLDHLARIISCALHIYEIWIFCPCAHVTCIFSSKCATSATTYCGSVGGSINPSSLPNDSCLWFNLAHWILHREKHKTLCQAPVLWHHNALALMTSHSKMWSLVR